MALVRSASFCYGKNWDMSRGEGLVTGRDGKVWDGKKDFGSRQGGAAGNAWQAVLAEGWIVCEVGDGQLPDGGEEYVCVRYRKRDDRLSQVWRSRGKHRITGGLEVFLPCFSFGSTLIYPSPVFQSWEEVCMDAADSYAA